MISAASAAKTAIAGFLSMAPRSKVFRTVSAVWRPMSMMPDGLTVTLEPMARSPAAANPFTIGGIQYVKLVMTASRNATSVNLRRNFAAMSSKLSRRSAHRAPETANSLPASPMKSCCATGRSRGRHSRAASRYWAAIPSSTGCCVADWATAGAATSATSTPATSRTPPRARSTARALVITDRPSRRHPEGNRRIARPGRTHRREPLAHRGRLLRVGVHLVRVVDGLDVRERRHGLPEQGQFLGRVHPDRAVQLKRLLVSLDAPELAFHGVEPRHARREVPGGPVRRVQRTAQRRERADGLGLLLRRVVPEDLGARKRPLKLRIDRAEAVGERLALLHERIHLGEGRVDLTPVWGPELPQGGELLLALLALHVHLLEPAGVVQDVPGEVRGIEDDPAAEEAELRPGRTRCQGECERDDRARDEESRLSQRLREPTALHRVGLLVEARGRGADRPRTRDPARRAGPQASRGHASQ